jgi:hypothetical protein
MVLPVMPTTVFLLVALRALSKSSLRFHGWLYSRPTLSRPIRAWRAHRVIPIPVRTKTIAIVGKRLSTGSNFYS